MTIFLTALHVVVCLLLILIVLLQRGKGADMGAAFGGSSQTVFGSGGAIGFLGKMTTVIAVLFMVTSLALAYVSSHKEVKTIMDDVQSAPSLPASPTGGATPVPAEGVEGEVSSETDFEIDVKPVIPEGEAPAPAETAAESPGNEVPAGETKETTE